MSKGSDCDEILVQHFIEGKRMPPRHSGRTGCQKYAWLINQLYGSFLEGDSANRASLLAAKRECRMRDARAALNVSEMSKSNSGLLTGTLSLQYSYISSEKIPIK